MREVQQGQRRMELQWVNTIQGTTQGELRQNLLAQKMIPIPQGWNYSIPKMCLSAVRMEDQYGAVNVAIGVLPRVLAPF